MLLRSVRLLALLGALCCWTAPVSAQSMQVSTPRYPMLFSKAVQQELKLTEEQNKKIQAKINELMPAGSFMSRPEPKSGGDVKAGGGEAAPPAVSFGVVIKGSGGAAGSPPIVLGGGSGGNIKFSPEGMPGLPDFRKIDEEVEKLLEPAQRTRLKQIALQRQGLSALGDEKTASELGLETEQKELVRQILDDQRKKTQEYFQKMLSEGGGIQQDQVTSFIKKQREQTEQDLAILLSPEQKTKWEELQGPKFDFKR